MHCLKPFKFSSDKSRIKQVLLNLISNSIKFTFEGGITIRTRRLWQNGHEFAEFKISDTGIGIKNNDQKKLFILFGMLNGTKSHNPNGTGIGLTVSKKYVELLGGKIHLESEFGKGTTVVFTIKNNNPNKELELFEEINSSNEDLLILEEKQGSEHKKYLGASHPYSSNTATKSLLLKLK
jgi:signal transduction histidine kinase